MTERTAQRKNPASGIEIRGNMGFATLDNGLKVITHKSAALETIGVSFGVNYGSVHSLQEANNVQTAHLLEHMLFQGTKKRNEEELLERLGDVSILRNGGAGLDYTIYYMKVVKHNLDPVLDLLSEMIMHSTLPEKELEKERSILIRENMGYQNDPNVPLWSAIRRAMYKDHIYSQFRTPDEQEIRSIPREMLVKAYREKYTPDNSVVALVGSISPEELIEKAEEHFHGFEGKAVVQEIKKTSLDQEYTEITLDRPNYEGEARVLSTFKIPSFSPGANEMEDTAGFIANRILSRRLWRTVRKAAGLAYEVSSYRDSNSFCGILEVDAKTKPENVSEVKDLIRGEISSMTSGEITAEEFKRAQERAYFSAKADREDNMGMANSISVAYLQHRNPFHFEVSDEMIREVDLQKVKAFCADYLDPKRMVLTTVLPRE